MAITFPLSHARARALEHARVPMVVLAAAVLVPALDLLEHLQRLPVVQVAGLTLCGVAAAGLTLHYARRPAQVWLLAAALALAASAALRLAGAAEAPALGLLAVLALGLGGAFRPLDEASSAPVVAATGVVGRAADPEIASLPGVA